MWVNVKTIKLKRQKKKIFTPSISSSLPLFRSYSYPHCHHLLWPSALTVLPIFCVFNSLLVQMGLELYAICFNLYSLNFYEVEYLLICLLVFGGSFLWIACFYLLSILQFSHLGFLLIRRNSLYILDFF
jgi:hypothetical protein